MEASKSITADRQIGICERKKMCLKFEELTHKNYADAQEIDRDDIPESFVDTIAALMDITDYGVEHQCIGHTFLVRTKQVQTKPRPSDGVFCLANQEKKDGYYDSVHPD